MELNYKTFGQGDPLVILHGLFGSLDNWQTLARQYAEHYTVFIIDLRNHGKSPHVDSHTYDEMAADIAHFMSDHWVFGARVIGHSMGGKVAMRLALDYPEQVQQLVVADIGVKQSARGHEEIFKAMAALDLPNLASRSDADAALRTRISTPSIRQFLLKNLSRNKEGGYEWKMNLPVIRAHYDDILAPIASDTTFENPTLFVRGERSDYVLDEDWSGIQMLFPESELVTIPKVGHWLHAEAPEAFLAHTLRFFQGQHAA